MSVTSISSTTPPPASAISRRFQEDTVGRQLELALQSGDLAGAQQAYNTLAAFGPNHSGPFVNPSLAKQFAALGQALQAGDLGTAQQVNAQLGTDLLKRDLQRVRHDIQQGGLENAQKAISDLKGDYWAITGQNFSVPGSPSTTEPTGSSTNGSPAVNVQA
ncbi:MAG: hypothetical protein ACRD3L_06835 [Terriglobales bacterium]